VWSGDTKPARGADSCPSINIRRDQFDGQLAGWSMVTGQAPAVSIQTQSLALRALRLDGNRAKRKRLVATASTEHPLAKATHATQAIAFGWKPGFSLTDY